MTYNHDKAKVTCPEGWAVVPIEPTQDMIKVGRRASGTMDSLLVDDGGNSVHGFVLAYRAMVGEAASIKDETENRGQSGDWREDAAQLMFGFADELRDMADVVEQQRPDRGQHYGLIHAAMLAEERGNALRAAGKDD